MPANRNVEALFASALQRDVTGSERIGGGRNSQVYRIRCATGESYAGKIYFRHATDRRDRLRVEFSSLQFLWQQGVREIARPIVADPAQDCAVYEYIEGARIAASVIAAIDAAGAVDFLGRLKALSGTRGSDELPAASDATLSVADVVSNVERRLRRMNSLSNSESSDPALHQFLESELKPAQQEITAWVRARDRDWTVRLKRDEQTLSPSDFGFHNALRRPDGRVVFLDFEYFGWDDPAKTVCDFVLHPAMELNTDLKRYFVREMLARFANVSLAKRIETTYPLHALNWCLIILNEFIPEDLQRREFAAGGGLDLPAVRARQLLKAQQLLATILATYKNSPLL